MASDLFTESLLWRAGFAPQTSMVKRKKRTWWMPWQLEAMKDVVVCEKSRGAGEQALIRECPNGETRHTVVCHLYLNT